MGRQYKALDWKQLTPFERAHRCRMLASEAEAFSGTPNNALKEQYRELALEWRKLASEIEAFADEDEDELAY